MTTQDNFKLFRVGVKSFQSCDHARSTWVPVAFATMQRCNSVKLKAWRDRIHHNVVSTVILSRGGKQCVAVISVFLHLSNVLVATRTLAHIERPPTSSPRPASTCWNQGSIASRHVDKKGSFVAYICGCMPNRHRIHASVAVLADVSVRLPRILIIYLTGKKHFSAESIPNI